MPERLPSGFERTGDPIEGNPFANDDPRNKVWADATRAAEAQVARIRERILRTLSALPVVAPPDFDAEQFGRLSNEATAEIFDAWAQRYVNVVWSDPEVLAFDAWLVKYAEAVFKGVAEKPAPAAYPLEATLTHLRYLLGSRVQHWKAEARRYRGEQERHRADAFGLVSPPRVADSWEDVEIRFLSERKVQVAVKGQFGEPQTYAEMGFEDRRSELPNQAWSMLLKLAEAGGEFKKPKPSEKRDVARVEKQFGAIRRTLRRQFVIPGNPDPFLPSEHFTYRARFRVTVTPSYRA